jgi:hypothetical protein
LHCKRLALNFLEMSKAVTLNNELVSTLMGVLGARGGRKRTAKKVQAARKNVLKAQAARRKKAT